MRQAADSLPLDVRTARRQFFDGRLVPPGTIPERIASSRQRAATYRLRRGDALGTNFVTHSQLRRLEAEHRGPDRLRRRGYGDRRARFRRATGWCSAPTPKA